MKLYPKLKWGGIVKAQDDAYIVINPGDTLSQLARKYHTSVAELQRLNNLGDSTKIYAGKKLKVAEAIPEINININIKDPEEPIDYSSAFNNYFMRRDQKATRDVLSKDNNDAVHINQFKNTPYGTYTVGTYTVKKGDTLSKIAQKYHIDIQTIAAMNDMKSSQLNHIKVGQKLKVPASYLNPYTN